MDSSSTSCSSLPEDILVLIFIYLPFTSIYRFKSVSKVWLSLLSNRYFITKWFQFNNTNKSVPWPWIQYHTISGDYSDQNPYKFRIAYSDLHSQFISRNAFGFSFEFFRNEKPFQGARLYLLGSSNGLVLCYSLRSDDNQVTEVRYHVCNPLTQKWVSLPPPPVLKVSGADGNAIFCETSLSTTCYKVVHIPRFLRRSKKFNVHVFGSDLDEWKSYEVSCDQLVSGYAMGTVTLNGVLFWLGGSSKMLVYNLNQNGGSDNHRCSMVDLPGPRFIGSVGFFSHTLGESEGWICYAISRVTGRQITVSAWVLEEDNNWQTLHKDISVHDTLAEICSQIGDVVRVRVIGFSPVDRDVVLLGLDRRVWWFNTQTRSFEELGHSSLLINRHTEGMLGSFVLKTMPTVLPPPSMG